MEHFYKEIPFETPEANLYSLVFSVFELTTDIGVPVIEVVLHLKKQRNKSNSVVVFNYIHRQIQQYLSENEVILYYYCDSSDIYYRNDRKRRFTSPQHFRSELFYTLFQKTKTDDLHIENIKIPNELHGNHFLSIIYKDKHQSKIALILKEIEQYQKQL